jgi:hypothetical protein
MAFLNPIFLLGALAVLAPIMAHLVRSARARRMRFPSLMFLRQIDQKTVRRRKLRNLWLLALRCSALMLLALAFARPYFPSEIPPAQDKSSAVILLDVSCSMQYGRSFERARQAAHRAIASEAGAAIALIAFSNKCDVLSQPTSDAAQLKSILDSTRPGLAGTDYLQAIQAADSTLKGASGRRRIYLISDFQKTGWDRAHQFKLSPGVQLIPVDVSEPEPSNLSLELLSADPVTYWQKYNGKLLVRANNFSAKPATAEVELKLNDLIAERRQIELAPTSSKVIEFTGFNLPEGSNRVTVEIADDDFAPDNRAFFAISRRDQLKVLIIETAPRGRSESFFLREALLAGQQTPYAPTIKTPGTTNPLELGNYQLIVLNDAEGIGQELAAALKKFVERGGGLIIAAGRHTDASTYNRLFGAISPARLEAIVERGGEYALLSQINADHPIFSEIARSSRLAAIRVYAYLRASPNERASVIAALDDGSPLIVEGLAGSGKVILITTTLDTAWNDLPLKPLYLPLIRQMLGYLGQRQDTASYRVGQPFAVNAGSDSSFPTVEGPRGSTIEGHKGASGQLIIIPEENGFYRLRYPDHSEYLAVNLDPKESDLSKLDIEEFIASVHGQEDQNQSPAQNEPLTPTEIESRQRLWLPILALALLSFVAEALLARRIRVAKLAK